MRLLVGLCVALGCGGSTSERTEAPRTEPEAPGLAAYPGPWDPNVAVELRELQTRRMFVVSERSAICPTREQAQARECGHSEEFPENGLRLQRGDDVLVVGTEPFDGHWRGIRFQLNGTLPSWIRADDLAAEPPLPFLESFEQRAEVQAAQSANGMSAEAVHALAPGTIVKLLRVPVRFGGMSRVGEIDSGLFLYVPTSEGVIAVRLVEDEEETPWLNHHEGLYIHDSLALDYVCDEGGYCDEVSILAMATPVRSPPPDDSSEEWPDSYGDTHMPVLVAVALADRFGSFTFQTPPWASAYSR
ncbi:MAG: hypothetical protein AAGE52_34905 [Myxococcota bacterium]